MPYLKSIHHPEKPLGSRYEVVELEGPCIQEALERMSREQLLSIARCFSFVPGNEAWTLQFINHAHDAHGR